jgi:hypothetical protein
MDAVIAPLDAEAVERFGASGVNAVGVTFRF